MKGYKHTDEEKKERFYIYVLSKFRERTKR